MSRIAWLAIAAASLACGCDRGPVVAKVSGRVTFAGKPVTRGQIMFQSDLGRPAIGEIGPDGGYSLTTYDAGDGAIVGNHVVTITATKIGPSSLIVASLDDEVRAASKGGYGKVLVPGAVEWLVPEPYSRRQTSPLRAVVTKENNVIDLDIEK
jgi:hypothetical protein